MKRSILVVVVLFAGACAADLDGADLDGSDGTVGELELEVAAHDCARPNREGKKCDDGLFCTVDDTCHAGECVGEERPCSDAVGFCEIATCDEAHDQCLPALREAGCVDRCDTTKLKKFYRKGWSKGFEAVSKDWDRRGGDCDRSDAFVDGIIRRIEEAQQLGDPEANLKAHRRCRQAGIADGAFAALDVVQTTCDEVCFVDGELVGELSATSYCEMAIGADGPLDVAEWLRGPINSCGLNYEVACDVTFVDVSTGYSNPAGRCEPLTVGQAFERTRDRSCDYRNRPSN